MKALILGCSHAAGSEMDQGEHKSYPVKIAQHLGFQPDNQAIPGGSNDAMFRIFESYCDLKKITSNDIVIACWTGSVRTEIFSNNQWIPLAQGIEHTQLHDYVKQWVTNDTEDWKWRLNKIKNIISLNEIAKYIGIPVININSFNIIQGFKPFNMYSKYKWACQDIGFTDWCLLKKYSHTQRGHFFEDAHQAFADLVINDISKIL